MSDLPIQAIPPDYHRSGVACTKPCPVCLVELPFAGVDVRQVYEPRPGSVLVGVDFAALEMSVVRRIVQTHSDVPSWFTREVAREEALELSHDHREGARRRGKGRSRAARRRFLRHLAECAECMERAAEAAYHDAFPEYRDFAADWLARQMAGPAERNS